MLRHHIARNFAAATRTRILASTSKVYTPCVRSLVHVNPPDLMKEHKKAVWKREGADYEPLPVPDVDERRTDDEEYVDDIEDEEINSILAEEYVEPEISKKFAAYMRIVNVAQPVRFMNKDALLHPTLKKVTYAFFEEAESAEHYAAIIDAASRCQEIDFLEDIISKVQSRGYELTVKDKLAVLNVATYRRSEEIFAKFIKLVGEDRAVWDKATYLGVIGFYEMMIQPEKADELFAEAVAKKVTYQPWRPIYRSHFFSRRAAQEFPTRNPMWDEQPEISDVVQLEGLPNLQARAALRYAIYSMQGSVKSDVHPAIRVPHNLVVQVIRRKRRGDGKNDFKAADWAPTKHQLMDYMRKYGVKTGQIADAGNLFYIEKESFEKLPTPSTLKK